MTTRSTARPNSRRPSSLGHEVGVVDSESPAAGPVASKSAPPRKTKSTSEGGPPSRARVALVRATGAAKWLVGAALVVATSGLVAFGAKRFMTHSPRFAIVDLSVSGNVRLPADAVFSRAEIASGENIFSVDVDTARKKLESDPWISSATVQRRLPGTVVVSVVEYEPRALSAVDGRLFLVARGGEMFKEVAPGDPMDLPVITGVSAADVGEDRERVSRSLGLAIDLVEDVERMGFGKRYPVQEVHLEADGTIAVFLGQNGIALHLGQPPYRGKLEQAERVFAELSQRKTEPSIVFLDNESTPERVVVRMR
jgi:cell division protein FtsQ